MNAQLQNVQLLGVKSVPKSIETFLEEKEGSSISTKKAYEKDIVNFFLVMTGKELSQLTVDDLKFEKESIINYRTYLSGLTKENGTRLYKNSSVNRFIESVRSLFKELRTYGYDEFINEFAFSFKDLPKNDSVSAGQVTEQEWIAMQEVALTLENGLLKSLLIGLAGRTSFRLKATLNLTWDNFTRIEHGVNKGMWRIDVIGKGNKADDKAIHDSFYQKLLELKVEGQDKIFNISSTAVDNAIKRICKLLGISESRNISFHSLKGFGINYVIDNGGNVFDVKKQANHVNIATSDKHYVNHKKDYTMTAGYLIDEELNVDVLDGLDKEQLLALIRSTSKSVQREIVNAYGQSVR